MLEPLVSIVIPCHAGSPRQLALLDETLRTVAAQTYSNHEAVVVDDGSPMDVAAVAARYPATRVIRQRNAGCALARNTGIGSTRGTFLVFLDADDYLLPEALAAGLACFRRHPAIGFAIGQREEMTYEGLPVPWGVPAMPSATSLYRILLGFDWYIIPPSSVIFRREVVDVVGGFQDPWGADDLDFYLRVAARFEGMCHGTPVTRYRRYSTSSSRDGERMLRSIRAVYARQLEVVRGDPTLEQAFERGLGQLTSIFADCLVENVTDRLRAREWRRALRSARTLAREDPGRFTAAWPGWRAAVRDAFGSASGGALRP